MGLNSSAELNLRANSYHGIILPDKDPKNQGRYKVHIPELHPLIKEKEGIWCKNQMHKWRLGPSEDYMSGTYIPIQPGTKVLIKFYQNDFHSGYIDRVVSDQIQQTNPKIGCGVNPNATIDRDDMYVFFKTPKYHNLFAVLEKTSDGNNGLTKTLMPNSLHLYYNYRRSTMTINEDGIHWFSMNNYGKTIEGHSNIWINQTDKLYVQGNRDVYCNGNYKKFTQGNVDHLGKGYCKNTYNDAYHLQSSNMIAFDAPFIFLNSGKTESAHQALTNKGEDEVITQNKIDMRIVAHQKRDDTFYGTPSKSTVGGSPPLPKMVGEKEKSKLSQGQSDRYSQVGQDQVGGNPRPFPQYPGRGKSTFMINLPSITSAISAIGSGMKGLTLSPLTAMSRVPSISAISQSMTGSINSAVSNITSGVNGLKSSVLSSIGSQINATRTLTNLSGKLRSLTDTVRSNNSMMTLNSLPAALLGPATLVKSIVGNAQSVSQLNNRLNNSINSYISRSFTNPITNTISSATSGVNQIKNLLDTTKFANELGNAIGTNNIGVKVANEINSLTSGNFGAGLISMIPGTTTAASIIDLIGNQMGLGGILSDIACNDNIKLELAIDNPLDKINQSLENLRKALESILDKFHPENIGEQLIKNMNLDAIMNALNKLKEIPNCQTIAKTVLQKSAAINNQLVNNNTNKKPTTWKG